MTPRTLRDEAREAHEARRWQAHPSQPPVELWRPRDAAAFLLSLLAVLTLLVLVLATGHYPVVPS